MSKKVPQPPDMVFNMVGLDHKESPMKTEVRFHLENDRTYVQIEQEAAIAGEENDIIALDFDHIKRIYYMMRGH